MGWVEFKLALENLDAEKVEEALLLAGALSVTLDDAGDEPLYEPDPEHPSLWSDTRVTGLFPAAADVDAIRVVLLAALGLKHLPAHRVEPLEDRDWSREWLKDFKPMRFGRRLWVCPTAFTPPDPQAVNLILDPGLAFGTGTHATTALCLEWLDSAAMAGKEVLDYGCGSGILAIAAARLGATGVWAVDHDPQALTATHENAARNHVENRIRACPPAALPDIRVDVILANILARPLTELEPLFARRLKPGGVLVLSGILEDQEDDLKRAYAAAFDFGTRARREGWLRLEALRRA
ncbi:MAG TPA: 50S ribosomal protein L11 methyltransferase [Gammaproteobacteria bacterium]|nr:50S ribosomal protein L11 methyltransferase [Gammaproteobacteria bacterium]